MTEYEKVIAFIKDQKAFQILHGCAISLMRKFNRRESAKESNDFIAEAYEALLKKSQGGPVDNYTGFCVEVIKNKILDENRKKINNSEPIEMAMYKSNEHKPSLEIEEIERIDSFMKKEYEDEKDHRIYDLHFHEGLPVRKITVLTKTNYNTTKNTLQKMRKSIKNYYTRQQVH